MSFNNQPCEEALLNRYTYRQIGCVFQVGYYYGEQFIIDTETTIMYEALARTLELNGGTL
jgi:hypothetical protein